jgi:hypothetical protein
MISSFQIPDENPKLKELYGSMSKVVPVKRDEPAFLLERERLKEFGYFVF